MASSSSQYPADYTKLSEVNACYQNSMTFVSKALGEDEHDNVNLAVEFYVKALQFLEDGVRIDISGPEYRGAEWGIARGQQAKMLKAHVQTKQRLYHLQESLGATPDSSAPAYAARPPEGHTSLSISVDESFNLDGTTELLTISSGVQLFFVSEDHHVGTPPPAYPTFLRVLVVNETEQVFLQVSDWTYPLIKGRTAALKTNSGAYIFPNHVTDTITQGCIGIVISSEVDHGLVETFENVLQNLALFRLQGEKEEDIDLDQIVHVPSTSDKIAGGIEKGAEWLGYGLSKGAEYTGDLVRKGSEKLKENLTPNDQSSSVSPGVQKGLYYTHEASKAAVKVSRFLVDGLCAITSKVGQEVAPHVKEFGKKILPESAYERDDKGESTVDGVIKVAGAGLAGFSTVWMELEKSGLEIARAVSSATVTNVEFKYGQEAGVAAGKAMGSVVNVGKTAFNLDNLGFKAIAKRAAKDTGKAVLMEYSADATKKKGVPNETSVDMEKPK